MPARKKNRSDAEFCLADFLPFKLGVVTDAVARVFTTNYVASYNLTIPEWRVLAVIAEHGTLTPTEVGQFAIMDKVKVSRATQSLIGKGLLRRSPHPNDGRGRLLRLTRKGSATHTGMVPLAEQLEASIFDGFSQSEKQAFDRLLRKFIARIETSSGAPSR
jgi:DNA-binding MarR family transcriptional regulator